MGSSSYALHVVALYFMYYNFSRVHQTLRVTPAMEAGIADHVWRLEAIVWRLDHAEAETRGTAEGERP